MGGPRPIARCHGQVGRRHTARRGPHSEERTPTITAPARGVSGPSRAAAPVAKHASWFEARRTPFPAGLWSQAPVS